MLSLTALASKTSPEMVFKSEVKNGFSLSNFDCGIDLCVSQVLVYLSQSKELQYKYVRKYWSN